MYETFFGLKSKPFNLVPDPAFLFRSMSHKRALNYLDYAIRERAGFVVLTGQVGSGKTTIIRDLVKKHQDKVILSSVFNTVGDFTHLLSLINDDFEIPVRGKDKIALLGDLNEFLIDQFAKGNKPVLIIDEAQNLSAAVMEEIRLLSNLETDNMKLLQIILVGQPELRKTLSHPNLLQLRQRISINCHINPLLRAELDEYILHRLSIAGNGNAAEFSKAAVDIIFQYSKGIPRLINIICDFLMFSAFAEQLRTIDEALVLDVIGDLDFENQYWSSDDGVEESKVQEPATIAPKVTAAPDRELTAALGQIMLRLDALEKEAADSRRALANEFNAKFSDLHKLVKGHVEESRGQTPPPILPDRDAERDQMVRVAEDNLPKQGLLRRIFG